MTHYLAGYIIDKAETKDKNIQHLVRHFKHDKQDKELPCRDSGLAPQNGSLNVRLRGSNRVDKGSESSELFPSHVA